MSNDQQNSSKQKSRAQTSAPREKRMFYKGWWKNLGLNMWSLILLLVLFMGDLGKVWQSIPGMFSKVYLMFSDTSTEEMAAEVALNAAVMAANLEGKIDSAVVATAIGLVVINFFLTVQKNAR